MNAYRQDVPGRADREDVVRGLTHDQLDGDSGIDAAQDRRVGVLFPSARALFAPATSRSFRKK
jgi:hypothetical protein